MIKSRISLGRVYYNRKNYCAACFQWRDTEEVYIKPTANGGIAVYDLAKRRICQTNIVAYPADLNYEIINGERLVVEDEVYNKMINCDLQRIRTAQVM